VQAIVAVVCATLTFGSVSSPIQHRYARAEQNENHDLVINTSANERIVIAKSDRKWAGAQQVGFDDIAISRDGAAVGWVDLYPNCCTSYPVPILLEVYKDGKRHTFEPKIAPVHWCFMNGSASIAAISTTLHGPDNQVIELWDVSTAKKHSEFVWLDGESHPRAPAWVVAIRSTQSAKAHECSSK
jgi:hypothetical protein